MSNHDEKQVKCEECTTSILPVSVEALYEDRLCSQCHWDYVHGELDHQNHPADIPDYPIPAE